MPVVCPTCHNAVDAPTGNGHEPVVCSSCGSSFSLGDGTTTGWLPAESGRRLGKFELMESVGVGAFGAVYKARDTELDRIVAIKIPRAGALGDSSGGAQRFLREARSVAQLRHPSIVSVHDVGQQDGMPYLVEDFVLGITLADRLTAHLPSPRDAVQLVASIADALQYAHEQGVVHRDIKPSNIMLDDKGLPHVMDFGLAKRDSGEATMTLEGQVMGTPAYMSPEQARGEGHEVDGRSDVYSLGVILYQLLTGSLPFKGNPRMLMHQVLHEEAQSPRKVKPGVPRDLETICLKAMAKERERRYATARELGEDLRRYLRGEAIQARPARLPERALKWVRRRPAVAALIAVVALALGGGLGAAGWYWQQETSRRKEEETRRLKEEAQQLAEEQAQQLKTSYFNTYVRRWGVPEGVGPLSEEEVAHRQYAFKFSHRGKRLEKMEIVNGSGALTTHFLEGPLITIQNQRTGLGSESVYTYHYDGEGRLADEISAREGGHVLWTFHYTTRDTGHYTDARGLPRPRVPSGATYVAFTRSPEGFDQEARYLDATGQPKPDGAGLYGMRYERDERGLLIRDSHLDEQGRPRLATSNRVAGSNMVYDLRGNLIERTDRGVDGRPTIDNEGVAKRINKYDSWGNLVEIDHFGIDGKPVLQKQSGRNRILRAFDARGNMTEERGLGIQGEPVLDKLRGVHKITFKYGERGHETERAFFGIQGQPVLAKDSSIHKLKRKNDDRGNMIEVSNFGLEDQPILSKGGFHKMVAKVDEYGHRLEEAFFGIDGQPMTVPLGHHKVAMKHDQHEKPIEWTFFDIGGKLILNRNGLARRTHRYDERANLLEEAFFGVAGEPVLTQMGYARVLFKYDEGGNRIETAYFGLDGQLVPAKDGYARATTKFDNRGNRTEQTYFGTDGKPILSKFGHARFTETFNERGNRIETAYFDVDGRPQLHKDGYARLTFKYDDRDNVIEEAYFGPNGEPARRKEGWSRVKTVRDADRVVGRTFFGFDPTTPNGPEKWHGYASCHEKFDERGNLTERCNCDGADKPVNASNGVARSVYIYDADNNRIGQHFFDADNKPVATKVFVFSVAPNSQAAKLGIKTDDLFLTFDGWEIPDDVQFRLHRKTQQGTKPLVVRRGSETLTFQIAPGLVGVNLDNRVVSEPVKTGSPPEKK
ncbi:MAG: protein kinase domain-containing protein [Gemmataceae bacterium]